MHCKLNAYGSPECSTRGKSTIIVQTEITGQALCDVSGSHSAGARISVK